MRPSLSAGITLALLNTTSVHAHVCDSLNLDDCLNTLRQTLAPESAAAFTPLEGEELAKRFQAKRALSVSTTGDVPLSVLGNSVSLNDLLPLLNISVDPGTSGDQSKSASISVEYSPTDPILNGDFKIGVAAREPEITDAFKSVIDDSEIVNALESDFDYSDDVEISLTYSYEDSLFGMGIGRSFSGYDDLAEGFVQAGRAYATNKAKFNQMNLVDLEESLFVPFAVDPQSIIDVLDNGPLSSLSKAIADSLVQLINTADAAQEAAHRIDDFIRDNPASPSADLLSSCSPPIRDSRRAGLNSARANRYGDCIATNFLESVKADVERFVNRENFLNTYFTGNNFFRFSSLVSNQPQLLFTANARIREELAGGDSYSAKLSFEFDMSGHNINNMFKYLENTSNWQVNGRQNENFTDKCEAQISSSGRNLSALGQACALAIGEYIGNNPVKTGGWRGALNLEYIDREDDEFMVEGVAVPLSLEGGSSVIGSIAVGRQFQVLDAKLPRGKLDFSASYEDVSDDPTRQDRWVGGLTFTQEVADALQLTIGVVWANKPEYRPDSDEEVTARIGLNYKLSGVGGD